ncbi:MAG TPA: nucleotide exchange factor GrpE [Fermentimonas sp.]|nr:nucleotide exchange factor GrpE [Fermentimonas sp.]
MKRNTNQQKADTSSSTHDTNEEELTQNELSDKDNLTEEETVDVENVDPQDEIVQLQQKYNELNDSFLRLNAEFDNFRKRTIKEKAEIIKTGGERVLHGIISLVDDFERGLAVLNESEDKNAMVEGMELIYNKFISFLNQNGVEEIEAIGQPFDADTFEAVTTIPVQEDSEKGVIVDCIQKGYKLNDKIIRFPKVVVGE